MYPPPPPQPIRILLADDDADDRLFFKIALNELSIPTHFTTVIDGEKLMHYLSENSHNLPDVLFLDLNMPRKTGFECLKEIKRDKKLNRIPVIIYSTSLHDTDADVLYTNGAHYYLKKCNVTELPIAINQVLTLLEKNSKKPSRTRFVIEVQFIIPFACLN